MSRETCLHLFDGFGVELEYMICDRKTLSVLPVADSLLRDASGRCESEIEKGDLRWSNEFVLHVIELKTNGPVSSWDGLAGTFQRHIHTINAALEPLGGVLLPTAMHPWMDPDRETRLWPHEYNIIYETYHRIFNCRGHGWSNLQSTHLNLPFADEEEFARLHAGIRLLLPILPAVTASSPIVELKATGWLDNRMVFYRNNSLRIPSITGSVIPEPIFSTETYKKDILQKMYADIASYDPEGILQHEWLNARGAIARFERNTIEIRVLDAQECPQAEIAVLWAIVAALEALAEERCASLEQQQAWQVTPLEAIFSATIKEADAAVISDSKYLRMFGLNSNTPCTAGDLWRHIFEKLIPTSGGGIQPLAQTFRVILQHGPLARRLLKRLHGRFSRASISSVYEELITCLNEGKLFLG
jgi:gamma-glutamyl:cysteine ligase YbdK (ATP-grasp superfamily)